MIVPAAASDTYMGYVSHRDANTISVFDPSSNAITTTFSTDIQPRGMYMNPAGTYLYVTCAGSYYVDVFRTSDYALITRITLPTYPWGICGNVNGDKLYVTSYSDNKLYVIDSTTNTVSNTITATYSQMRQCVYTNGKVYVAFNNDAKVGVFSTVSNTFTSYIAVGVNPNAVHYNSAHNYAYVACTGDGKVYAIDTSADTVSTNINVGSFPYIMSESVDGAYLYVPNYNSANVTVITTATNTVSGSATVGLGARGAAVEPNGAYYYVTNMNDQNITIINAATNSKSGNINLSYTTPDNIIIAKINPGTTPTSMEVAFNVNIGGIVNVYNANVSIYDADTGALKFSDPTDSAGNSIFTLITGKRYTITVTSSGTSVSQSIQVQHTDNFYYVDMATGEILGATQYAKLYDLHPCTLYVYNWGSPEKYANIQLFKNGTLIKNATTDETGGAAYNVQSDVLYTIRVYNTSKSLDKNFTEYLNSNSRTLDLWVINIGGWTTNESTLEPGKSDSIYVNGSVAAGTVGGTYYINCTYNDSKSGTTLVNYTLYVSQNGNLTQLATHTNAMTGATDKYNFTVVSPTGKDYTVKIVGVQSNNVTMWYYYHWPGAMVPIPGLPLDWYKYISLLVIGGVALGTATRINIGFTAGLMSVAALFLNNVLGWMFEIPYAYVLIRFMFIISIVMIWTQKSKGEI